MVDFSSIQYRFANRLGEHSLGGIILCGMNWGGGGHGTTEANNFDGWTEYFSSLENRYKYQEEIIKWFAAWGFPLTPDDPSIMDKALSQTNLFLNSSKHFNHKSYAEEDWIEALENLSQSVSMLKASAILFFSIGICRDALWRVKEHNVTAWNDVMGISYHNEEHVFYDSDNFRKYFSVFFTHADKMKIAAVPHPTPQRRGVFSDKSVKCADTVMTPWLQSALDQYDHVQKERSKLIV